MKNISQQISSIGSSRFAVAGLIGVALCAGTTAATADSYGNWGRNGDSQQAMRPESGRHQSGGSQATQFPMPADGNRGNGVFNNNRNNGFGVSGYRNPTTYNNRDNGFRSPANRDGGRGNYDNRGYGLRAPDNRDRDRGRAEYDNRYYPAVDHDADRGRTGYDSGYYPPVNNGGYYQSDSTGTILGAIVGAVIGSALAR